MKKSILVLMLTGFLCISLLNCASLAENTEYEVNDITFYSNPRTRQRSVPEGNITFVHVATGKYCDVFYDRRINRPSDIQLSQIISGFDKDYERLTSFLNLYERGGGPNGNGGADKNPRFNNRTRGERKKSPKIRHDLCISHRI